MLVILTISLGVPIPFVEPFSVQNVVLVLFVVLFVSLKIVVVIRPIFLVQLSEPFFSEKSRPRIVSFLMTLVLLEKVFVVFILSKPILNFLLALVT